MTAPLDAFADEARRYTAWARGESGGPMDAPTALRRLVALYAAALELPPPFSAHLRSEDAPRWSENERHVFRNALKLPFRYYGLVCNPIVVPPEEPVVGDLAGDLDEIHADVAVGLRLFDRGLQADALWEWGFGFRTHWGDHAIAAVHALHAYLSEAAGEGLSAI